MGGLGVGVRGGERPLASIWLYLIDSAMFVDVSVLGGFLAEFVDSENNWEEWGEKRREKRYRDRERERERENNKKH